VSGRPGRGLADLYAQQFRTTVAVQLQYRASLLIWLLGNVLAPLVSLAVWTAASHSSAGGVAGFSAGDFSAYYLALMLVNHLTFTWIMFEYEYRVRHGSLSFALLRPVHPIHSDVADNVAFKLLTFPGMLLAAVVVALAFPPSLHFTPWSAAAFIPALLLAFLLRFLLEWTLALTAFWTTRVGAVNQGYFVLSLFLSGQVAPLPLLPVWARTVAAVLPFRWTLSFPVELLLGRLSPAQALAGFAAQAGWLAAAFLLMGFTWRRGVRAYSAVGA
jgi:ABC-2 type transport system permease protein